MLPILLKTKTNHATDYPLPPDAESTEILRVVVRESMALDLLDKLIADIAAVTESVCDIENDFDLAAWQPFPKKEATQLSKHEDEQDNSKAKKTDAKTQGLPTQNMDTGIHRTVC